MAYIEVEVDIDIEEHLDEVSVSDLINELSDRRLTVVDKKELVSVLNDVSITGSKVNTLVDELKLDVVLSGIKNKTLIELQEFFK